MTRHGTIGIAISETAMYAELPAARGADGRRREWVLAPLGRADADWPSLTSALAELREALPKGEHDVAVALLPPLVQVRRVELPTMRAHDRRLILSRSAGKYIPGVREPYIANGVALTKSSPAPHLIAAAAARLVEAVTRAVADSGWTLKTIVSAYDAWTTAGQKEWAALRDGGGDLLVPWNSHVELLQIEQGDLTGVRRVRADEVMASRSSTASPYKLDHPTYAAAVAAAETDGIELLPERIYAGRTLERRRLSIWLGSAAAALLVLAAVAVLLHAQYVLHQVQAQREALAPQARRAAAAAGDLATVAGPLNALGRIETNAVRWSDVIADLTEVFPSDASLTSFRGHGDSLSLAGTAARGADVFEHLDGARLVDHVQSSGPIRREIKDGGQAVDRFQLVARLPGAAPLFSSKQPKGKRQ